MQATKTSGTLEAAPPRRTPLAALIAGLRPKQWTKNLLLFAALLFTIDRHHSLRDFEHAALGFVLFSLLSGSGYLINDVLDVETDREHPLKRRRPIASGDLGVGTAITAAVAIGAACIAGSWALGIRFGVAATAYLALTLAYTLKLKHVVILDLLTVACCFVLRAVAGAWVIPPYPGESHVLISPWLILCTLLLALFLGISKRRGELVAVRSGRRSHRPILTEYTAEMLDQMSTIVTSSLLMSYVLYTIQSSTAIAHPYLMVTIPFVLYGIFRYLYLIHMHNLGESPDEVLLKDRPLQVNILLFALTTAVIIAHPFARH